ncbi:hypothetical protein [Curtobacterium phage Penoan]|nr:hypothetical protein [Curtobacterium phage Penoan]
MIRSQRQAFPTTALALAYDPYRFISDATDRMIGQHFQDTPLALQVAQRTGVLPFPVVVTSQPTPDGGMWEIRVSERIRGRRRAA